MFLWKHLETPDIYVGTTMLLRKEIIRVRGCLNHKAMLFSSREKGHQTDHQSKFKVTFVLVLSYTFLRGARLRDAHGISSPTSLCRLCQ